MTAAQLAEDVEVLAADAKKLVKTLPKQLVRDPDGVVALLRALDARIATARGEAALWLEASRAASEAAETIRQGCADALFAKSESVVAKNAGVKLSFTSPRPSVVIDEKLADLKKAPPEYVRTKTDWNRSALLTGAASGDKLPKGITIQLGKPGLKLSEV